MFKLFKGLFKTKDEKALSAATENFDELMVKVDEDQKDLSQFEHSLREEWEKINKDVDKVRGEVDDVVNKKAA